MSESYELSYGEVLRELRIYHGYKQKDISDIRSISKELKEIVLKILNKWNPEIPIQTRHKSWPSTIFILETE